MAMIISAISPAFECRLKNTQISPRLTIESNQLKNHYQATGLIPGTLLKTTALGYGTTKAAKAIQTRNDEKLYLCQDSYIEKLAEKYNMIVLPPMDLLIAASLDKD